MHTCEWGGTCSVHVVWRQLLRHEGVQLEGLVDMDAATAQSQPQTLFKKECSRVVSADVKQPIRMFTRTWQ